MATPTIREDGTIRTRRLLLRAAQESDLVPLHQLLSNEDVMRYWYSPPSHPLRHPQPLQHQPSTATTNSKTQVMCPLHLHPPNSPLPAQHARLPYKRRFRLRHRPHLTLNPEPQPPHRSHNRQSRHLAHLQLRNRLHAFPFRLGPRIHGRSTHRLVRAQWCVLEARGREGVGGCGSEEWC